MDNFDIAVDDDFADVADELSLEADAWIAKMLS